MKLVSHNPEAGLFSQINFLITWFERSGSSEHFVDWREGLVYCQPSRGNLFEHLFEQSATASELEKPTSHWPHPRYTSYRAVDLYNGDPLWRSRLHRWWLGLKVRAEIMREVEEFFDEWNPCIALHVRNEHIASECPDGRAPTLSDFEKALEGLEGRGFVGADNDEALESMRRILGPRVCYRRITRSPDMRTELHLSQTQTIADARNCLVDALIMARCRHLVHSVSNIATAVLYMNPGMAHTFVTRGLAATQGAGSNPRSLMQTSAAELIFVEHDDWRDWILIYEDGTFRRHDFPAETGSVVRLSSDTLHLDWVKWGGETFRLVESVHRSDSFDHKHNRLNTLVYRLAR